METLQLTFSFKEGSTATEIARKLRHHAGLLEGMEPKEASAKANTETDDDDDDFKPTKGSPKKQAKSFDDEEPEETENESDDEAPPKKAKGKKSKKITSDDVNDACKKRASGDRRKEVLAILKKQFKTESVSDIEEDQYADVIKAMTVDEDDE